MPTQSGRHRSETSWALLRTRNEAIREPLAKIAVSGENGVIRIEAIDSKNPSSDTYSITVDTPIYNIDAKAKFRMIFLAENIKVLLENYTLSISSRGLAHFKGSDIEYWIATESSSTYKADE